MSDPVVSISISDTTLKEQANLKTKPEKLKVDGLIGRLQSEDETVIRKACDELAHCVFIPWLNKQNQANKMYFCKQGGVKLLVKWMKEGKDEETQADAGTAVWNFSESSVMHEILWREGAGHALFEFLQSGVPRKERVAIGALFGLLDYGSNHKNNLSFSPDRDLVKKILDVKQDTWSFNLAKVGCLLSLAKYASARNYMVELGALKQLQEENNDVLINYLQTLALAHLLAENPQMDAERESCLQKIEKQIQVSPVDVRKKESRHGVVWSSTLHLLRLLRDNNPVLRLFALHAFANLSYGDYNRSLMLEEDVLGSILYSQWVGDRSDEKKKYIEIILKNFETREPVPSLFQIGYNNIMHRPQFAHVKSEVESIFPDLVMPM